MLEDQILDNGLVLGLFRPEDAPGIVECYREVYGESFPLPYVYDPEAIAERNAQGKQHMLVVRDTDGRVAGLIGLFPVDGCPEMFEARQLIVREGFHHLHLGRILTDACFRDLPPMVGAKVLMGEAVCETTVSQELAAHDGMIPTGLELDSLPE
ncbi:MAG: GNAT family N-acetyltransferase, partial [Deltaproteobacteria bacterium]|nr:GNAT family N-acetyltransferase [Deltaproteobacteria bacterium]